MKIRMTMLALACVLPVMAGAQTLERWGRAGGWDVMIDPTLGNGCLIQAVFDDGSVVRIGFDQNQDAGYVTAFNGAWGDLEEGATYDIAFDLDGEQYRGQATGLYLNGVPGADISFDNVDFLVAIAAKRTMTLYNESGRVMAIDLSGTSAGIQEAFRCQSAMDSGQDKYGPGDGVGGGG